MKKFILVVLAIAALASCTKGLEQTPAGGITGTVVPFAYDDATRTNLVYNQTGLDFTWSSKDRVAVFGPGGEQQLMMKINVKEGEAVRTATFTITESYSLKKGFDYVAYCPMVNDMELKASAVNFKYPAEQEQTGNGRECTGHIGQYDFMVSGLTPATADNKAAFSFVHKCCPVLVEITDVPAGTYSSVALRAPGSIFTTEGTYDIFNDVPTSTTMVDKVTVSFKEPVTLASKGTLSVWMMMAPASAGGMKLEVEVTATDGKNCSGELVGRDMTAGSAYLYTTKAKPDSGELTGEFSVSKTQKVKFSKGNLWCRHKEGTDSYLWYFEENQYDYRTFNNHIAVIDGKSTTTDTDDWGLIGWSGSTGSSKWGVSTNSGNTYTGSFADWGMNAIENGGGEANLWRTLTPTEWAYIFSNRPNASKLAGKSTVNDVFGMVVLPDNFTYPSGSTIASTYSKEDWGKMEKNGAVFLPAAGIRSGTNYAYTESTTAAPGLNGRYWNSALSGNAYCGWFSKDKSSIYNYETSSRYKGFCVRLVKNVVK